MKNIKLRIVYLILCSALLLFALFMLAVNLIIPAHFVSEAKKALISEAEYQNRTIPYTDDGSFFDDGWNDTEEHFLTPSIVFLELDNANQSSGWNRDAYRLEKKLLEYCAGRDIALNQCYTFKTDRHHLIFMSVQEDYGDGEEPYSYIMYIDIGPITRYIVTLNWAFFAVLLAISSVMCLLGFRFGRDIEKEAERQQTFFQNASHELKTPLTIISANVDILHDEIGENKWLSYIQSQAERMRVLVGEMMNLTKLEMGDKQKDFVDFSLSEAVSGAALPFEGQAFEQEKQLELDIQDGIRYHGNPDQIKQLVGIFIDNALKYSEEHGQIRVTLQQTQNKKVLKVYNTGKGIPESEKEKIFQRFYRSPSASEAEGVGIGLYLARQIAAGQGGYLKVSSRPGEGSTFSLFLPRAEERT